MYIVLEYVTCTALVALMATLVFAMCVAFLVVRQGAMKLAGMLHTARMRFLFRTGPRGTYRVKAKMEPTTQI